MVDNNISNIECEYLSILDIIADLISDNISPYIGYSL